MNFENLIKESIIKAAEGTGWANLAKVGLELRKNGVVYDKLLPFLKGYRHIIEKKIDNSFKPPVIYVRIRMVKREK